MRVIAFYKYRSPAGTLPEGEAPMQEDIFYTGLFGQVWAMIREDFDGQETFDSLKTEAQIDLHRSGSWNLDDWSAGQYVNIQLQVPPADAKRIVL